MKPLLWVAAGLAVLVLSADVHGYDLLANPLGWLAIAYGVAHLDLPEADARRPLGLVAVAGVVAAVLWPGPVAGWLEDTDDSLAWVATLPGIVAAAVLCGALALLARRAEDRRATRWFEVARTVTLVAGVLPVLVLGGHMDALSGADAAVSLVAPVLLLVLAVRYSGRPWAAARPPARPAGGSEEQADDGSSGSSGGTPVRRE